MKVHRSILSALNVHRDEWWLVQKLFLFQFFQGAGIVFFFTSSLTRFLEHFSVSSLSYVYIITSVLLWVAGFIYNKLEHSLSPSKLNVLVTVFIAFSLVFFRILSEIVNQDWYYFLMLSWFYVLYLLNNLMFWGLAAQLYDVRQSKRLFGVISAGDIPAKFIGYTVALLMVSYLGTLNLLLAGFVFVLLSFPFLNTIMKHEKSDGQHEHGNHEHNHHEHGHQKQTTEIHKVVKNFTGNTLVFRVALLSLIVYICIILINFAFYAEIKHETKNDIELASFIAFFMASARLAAMVIKIIMTSRLLYWLGNKASLILTPLLLFILVSVSLLSDSLSGDHKITLYIFGFSAILIDVLNSAINSPVLLTIMQPLPTHERLRAHNIVKGIMDPFAYLFSGIFLLVLYNFKLYSLTILAYSLLFFGVIWMISIFRVHQQYLKILIHAVSSRFFNQEDFNFYDASAREMIEKKLLTGNELEVMYILRMLAGRKSEESNRLIILALKHTNEKVVLEALRIIRELHLKDAEEDLVALIANNEQPQISSEAIKVLATINFREEIIEPLFTHSNKVIMKAAIMSALNHSPRFRQEAENIVGSLLSSEKTEEKSDALDILCETHDHHFDGELIKLLNINDKSLELKIIRALGIHASENCLAALISKLNDLEKPVIEALIIAREKSLPFIKKRILDIDSETRQNDNLLNAIGRIGGKSALETLYELLHEKPQINVKTIKVLHRCRFKAGKDHQQFIESIIREQLIDAAAILHMQKAVHNKMDKYAVLFTSLQLELLNLRESLLNLFSFLYDREQINKIKTAIEINKKETNANAIELVDMTVKKEFANPFNAAFEFGDLEYRCSLLKNLLPRNVFITIDNVIGEILSEEKNIYNNWSKASSLYISKKYEHKLKDKVIQHYIESGDILLKETAEYAAGIY